MPHTNNTAESLTALQRKPFFKHLQSHWYKANIKKNLANVGTNLLIAKL